MTEPDMEEPFHIMMEICKRKNTNSYKMIKKCIDDRVTDVLSPKDICLGKDDTHTKFVIYRTVMNEGLSVHPVYMKGCLVPDYKRVYFTRLRLLSHNLMSEKGRWSRTPANERVCQCNNFSVQDEQHILLVCPKTQNIRHKFAQKLHLRQETMIKDIMRHGDISSVCDFIHQSMVIFD